VVEAIQARDELPLRARAELDELLAPPAPMPYFVEDDEPFPVRVYFSDPSQTAYAERIVAGIETSYELEVGAWGFWAPLLPPGGGPYLIFIEETGPGSAAYTAPYLSNPDTPHEDSFSYMVFDPGLSDVLLDVTVAHEFNHACQAAMDMAEPASFFEATATYVESLVFPAGASVTHLFYPPFQKQAHLPIEYAAPGASDGYEYGASLWLAFLAHAYGSDDPAWIRSLWEGSVQVGPDNEPDHRDVLDELIADRGGEAGAIREFGLARFFVGTDDDGGHLPGAGAWVGSEVPLTASWSTSQLPVLEQGPAAATRPRPSGCNYVGLSSTESSALPIRFTFDGQDATPYDVSVITVGLDGASNEVGIALDGEAYGTASISSGDLHHAVLVVCQALGSTYDLDDKLWPAADYRYDIELDVLAPSVDSVEPAEVHRGVHGVPVRIIGAGFVDGPDFVATLSGSKVVLSDIEVVSAEEVIATLTVAPTAGLGPRDVIVTNPGGAATTAAGLIAIVSAPADAPPPISPSGESDGGGCTVSPAPAPPWTAAGLTLGAIALLARRQRPELETPQKRRTVP
jgi:MYXO-CTERM domain-containing protein